MVHEEIMISNYKHWVLAFTIPLLAGCNTALEPNKSSLTEKKNTIVRIDGSSTVFTIAEATAEEFQKSHPETKVIVGVSGTGGGFKKFTNNEIDLANASRPIKSSEAEACARNHIEFVEIPIAYDGIAVVVNPQNDWARSITTAELKKIWQPSAQKKVTRWNQIRAEWPDKPINLYGPGVDSGTYDYFTEAVVGKQHASRGDYTSSEDDNLLVRGVSSDPNALGFFGYAYYELNKSKLRIVAVDDEKESNGTGPITPSPESIRGGTYQPLSRPLFVYANKNSLERAEVDSFARFLMENASALVSEVGYVPLPATTLVLAEQRLSSRTTGTLYATEKARIGSTIEDLLKANRGKNL
jgi:phosphate transport system substrate-binding protein